MSAAGVYYLVVMIGNSILYSNGISVNANSPELTITASSTTPAAGSTVTFSMSLSNYGSTGPITSIPTGLTAS